MVTLLTVKESLFGFCLGEGEYKKTVREGGEKKKKKVGGRIFHASYSLQKPANKRSML